jgi:hypothetical protein
MVGLDDRGGANTTARVVLLLILDGRIASTRVTVIAGGQTLQVPAQMLVSLRPGRHVFGAILEAQYRSFEPGDVLVSPLSLIVSALPPL